MAAAEGNRYGEKHSLEEWETIFEGIYDKAVQGEYTSLQDAFMSNDVRPSTERWLCSRYKALASIKKDIAEAIIRSLNDKALFIDNRVSPAIAIWRMKQLGETEKQVIENTNTVIELTTEERSERIQQLKNKI
jgi:hypothetical protein